MRRVPVGTKIRVPTELGPETGTIVYHEPSPQSKDVYMIRWSDGVHTLYEVCKENLVKDDKKRTN